MKTNTLNESAEAIDQEEVSAPKQSKAWIFLSMGAGLSFGLGNTIFGLHCSQRGVWGGAFTGPMPLLITLIYRLGQACCVNKRQAGSFIDKANSNYWKPAGTEDTDDFQSQTNKYRFNWKNFTIMFATQTLPIALGLFLVSYAFKFALAAEINQGAIPSIFSVTGIYIAILFYFCFNEVISPAKIGGIVMIVLCVIFLAFDEKSESLADDTKQQYTVQEQRVFGGLAIVCSLVAPIFWTFKAYFTRKAINQKLFTSTLDLAIDCQLSLGALMTFYYIVFLTSGHDFVWREILEGSATGFFFMLGAILNIVAYNTGPGGPINALSSSQIVYQTLITSMFFDQSLSSFQYVGVGCGIAASLLIALCDDILKRCRTVD